MARKHYDEASCVRSLSRKNSIRFTQMGTDKYIQVLKNHTDVGNGSWGKIDYLCKIHNYRCAFVKEFIGAKKVSFVVSEDNNNELDSKTIKREYKLNMATMAKTAMKRVKTK